MAVVGELTFAMLGELGPLTIAQLPMVPAGLAAVAAMVIDVVVEGRQRSAPAFA